MLEEYGRDEGAALAKVALQHLFRVYPELRVPAVALLEENPDLSASIRRTLFRYGIAGAAGSVSGAMMHMALAMVTEEMPSPDGDGVDAKEEARPLISEWAEELAGISYRRNVMERSLRSIVINFLRMAALTSKEGRSRQDRAIGRRSREASSGVGAVQPRCDRRQAILA